MTKIKLFLFALLITIHYSLFTFAPPAQAAICNPVLKDCTSTTAPKAYFNSALSAVISIFFIVGIVYFVWHIVFAGYHLIASEGDPKRWESSKSEIIYATIGIFVVFSIFAILKFVGIVLGIPGLESLTISWPSL